MKYLVCLLVVIFCLSCRNENLKKIDAEEIAKKELQNINFSEVDRYPLFKSCDETAPRSKQQNCFEQELHKWLKPHLDSIAYDDIKDDSIYLNLSILSNGKINLDSISSKTKLAEVFQDIFNQSPVVYPAQKRGIPVKVSFRLPVVLQVE